MAYYCKDSGNHPGTQAGGRTANQACCECGGSAAATAATSLGSLGPPAKSSNTITIAVVAIVVMLVLAAALYGILYRDKPGAEQAIVVFGEQSLEVVQEHSP